MTGSEPPWLSPCSRPQRSDIALASFLLTTGRLALRPQASVGQELTISGINGATCFCFQDPVSCVSTSLCDAPLLTLQLKHLESFLRGTLQPGVRVAKVLIRTRAAAWHRNADGPSFANDDLGFLWNELSFQATCLSFQIFFVTYIFIHGEIWRLVHEVEPPGLTRGFLLDGWGKGKRVRSASRRSACTNSHHIIADTTKSLLCLPVTTTQIQTE